ncbi:MAG: arsenate reductase ArsC [Planctomycetes bacterium]|nr:arsenate reductase ArsC [Planctomycetota bacterium]
MSDERKKVLFLCTGNSCRSQMAEGWANHLRSKDLIAFSAGVNPGKLNDRAVAVMKEVGVDISSHIPQHVDDFAGLEFDLIVTVCDNAKELCPIFGGKGTVVHNKFDDPSEIIATEENTMAEFRRVRDEIRDFIKNLEI